ncbi:type III-B CRISPR module RAMP protein Cmr1 [Thiococcus pfennigii]|uniref:type III-B CRISPR module RAMP protein Cmr1 n=1 Tax=Thiococcus pfennigii TaxID=1057 RepID=UPI0019065C61|nr:type III-B CRISPR module RAMP protein Cmr1 [Thiococcus pfennigii]MBK1700191.1 type III-B CRISPR module RAMP protein Cmr1 [Thiococcus pfennigii]
MLTRWTATPLTPLVTAGAENRPDEPRLLAEGLRAPEVKGMARYWFRLLAATVFGGDDDTAVSTAAKIAAWEGAWFGDTECGGRLKLVSRPCTTALPTKTAHLRMNNAHGRTAVRCAIVPADGACDPYFRLELRTHDARALRVAVCCLWLISMLGGVGARTRRGFGSLAIALTDADFRASAALQDLDLRFAVDSDLCQIAVAYESGLKIARRALAEAAGIGSPRANADLPALHASKAALFVVRAPGGAWSDWEAAMNGLRTDFYGGYKQSFSVHNRLGSPSNLNLQLKRDATGEFYGVVLCFHTEQHRDEECNELANRLYELENRAWEIWRVDLPSA